MKTWNYLNPNNDTFFQNDWNQTIVSMFNEIVAENNIEIRPVIIISPTKFKPLFDTLYYYLSESLIIGSEYTVLFTTENNNIIKIGDYELEILNYIQ